MVTVTRSTLFSAAALCLLLAVGCGDGPGNTSPDSRSAGEARLVTLGTATVSDVERTITVFGSFLAREQATLSTKVQGRLASIHVDLGSTVTTGSEIAQIEPREYELRVRQAEAALAQARARLGLASDDETSVVNPEETSVVRQAAAVLREATSNRDRLALLHRDGVLSKAELDTADATFTIAENRFQDALEDVRQRLALVAQRKAERDIAAQQLTDTRLVAPFDAAVQDRRASPGEFLRAGDPVVTLVQMNPLRLRLEVSERDAPKLATGQTVRARLEGVEREFVGKILRVSPAIDALRRVLIVEADIPNDGSLHPGMFARADIVVLPRDPALLVPAEALATFAGIEKVYTVVDGKATERVVTTGLNANDSVEILRNLQAGEKVILNPGKMQNGQPVRIDEGSPAAVTPAS